MLLPLCITCLGREIGSNLPWFGAIFGAIYISLYTRFSSQWTYLAGLYNQLMASQVLEPFTGDGDRARTYVAWWAAFVEDAEDVHLALKKNYAAVIVGLLQDARIRTMYVQSTVGGAGRLADLERQLEVALGAADFETLRASGAALAARRQSGTSSSASETAPPLAASEQMPLAITRPRTAEPTTPHALPPLPEWKVKVNAQYLRIIDLVISLSTAALVLPPLFLKDFFGIRDEPLALFLDEKAFWSWGLLSFAIFLGICFHYASAKWIKQASGLPVMVSPKWLERLMDWVFWATVASFMGGLVLFVLFIRES